MRNIMKPKRIKEVLQQDRESSVSVGQRRAALRHQNLADQ